ncbi:hypothetical protein LG003_20295 [Photorhabdus kleinii]|uniref:hypothetical protein n=1 Tax=Photorhabdus kleinii TaxID=768034 RepID=UPI0021D4F3D1|nr:hypothetical protein [Photorhabdus kleinii]MCT8345117.1 hypothetical protein [Photorhabdus kleinii]
MLTCDMKQFEFTIIDAWNIGKRFAKLGTEHFDFKIHVIKNDSKIDIFEISIVDVEGVTYQHINITEKNIEKLQQIIISAEACYSACGKLADLIWNHRYENN